MNFESFCSDKVLVSLHLDLKENPIESHTFCKPDLKDVVNIQIPGQLRSCERRKINYEDVNSERIFVF